MLQYFKTQQLFNYPHSITTQEHLTLKIQAVQSVEMSVTVCQLPQCNNMEDLILQ